MAMRKKSATELAAERQEKRIRDAMRRGNISGALFNIENREDK